MDFWREKNPFRSGFEEAFLTVGNNSEWPKNSLKHFGIRRWQLTTFGELMATRHTSSCKELLLFKMSSLSLFWSDLQFKVPLRWPSKKKNRQIWKGRTTNLYPRDFSREFEYFVQKDTKDAILSENFKQRVKSNYWAILYITATAIIEYFSIDSKIPSNQTIAHDATRNL